MAETPMPEPMKRLLNELGATCDSTIRRIEAAQIYIDGVQVATFDTEQFVACIDAAANKEPDERVFQGLRRMEQTITLTGRFDDGTILCSCGTRFTPATSTPTASVTANDSDMGMLCDACTIAVLPLLNG